jgi:hypothetical protein
MRRVFIVFATMVLIQVFVAISFAQGDKLTGRWEGKMSTMQGERPATATFKKEGDQYTGTITGMRGDLQLKEIKIDGEKVTAKAEIETPQGNLVINYTLKLEGESLKGQGALDFNGNAVTIDVDLKRAAAGSTPSAPTAPSQAPAQSQGEGQRPRSNVPQPQQKQSLDYFVGQWSFKYIGRESAFGMAPREGVVTFTKRPDGKSLDGTITGKHDGGAYKESLVIVFDEATKMMTFTEKLASGLQVNSKGDWTSPIAIRFTVEPVKVKGQTLQLKRTISVVAGHSFTVTEELSENGGPFVRLGNTIYSKVMGK